MIETKKLVIGGKEYYARCSLLTTEAFERTTGKKFSEVISTYQRLGSDLEGKDENESTSILIGNIIEIEMDAIKLAYCMIQEAKRKGYNDWFNADMEDFIDEVGSLNSEELKGVLQLAMSVFPRKVQN